MPNKREDLLGRISVDPKICFGKPCIRGHRIWVSLILDLLADGWSIGDVLNNYPGIEETDVRACIAYGAEMSRERYVELTSGMNWVRFRLPEPSKRGSILPASIRTVTDGKQSPGQNNEY